MEVKVYKNTWAFILSGLLGCIRRAVGRGNVVHGTLGGRFGTLVDDFWGVFIVKAHEKAQEEFSTFSPSIS